MPSVKGVPTIKKNCWRLLLGEVEMGISANAGIASTL